MVLLGWGVGWASVVWVWVVMWMAPYQSCLRPVGPHLLQFRRCLYVQENRGRQQTAAGSGRVRRPHRPGATDTMKPPSVVGGGFI